MFIVKIWEKKDQHKNAEKLLITWWLQGDHV